jgi:Ca2+-binding RTX toxin-like protein
MAIATPRFGTAGNDTMTGEILVPQPPPNDPVIDPNYWQDELHGLGGNDTLSGLGNDDWLYGDAGSDSLSGGDGNDLLVGGTDTDVLTGGIGDDILIGGAGADSLDGGAGTDIASYADSTAGVSLDLGAAIPGTGGDALGDTLVSVEAIVGSGFNDVLEARHTSVPLNGGAGNDTLGGIGVLNGGAGDDVMIDRSVHADYTRPGPRGSETTWPFPLHLDGGAGSDTVSFAASEDRLHVYLQDMTIDPMFYFSYRVVVGQELVSVENIIGSAFNDELYGDTAANRLSGGAGSDFLAGYGGGDTLDGGAGSDTVSYLYSFVGSGGVTVDLAAGHGSGGSAEGSTLISIENVEGTVSNDVITGSAGANGLYGNDSDDVLRGGDGADRLDGGNGIDIASYYNSSVGVTVNLATNTGSGGDAAGDKFYSIENVNGSQGNDSLTGNAGTNGLQGWGGDDILRGGAGADILDGGANRDLVSYWDSAVGVNVSLLTGVGTGGDAQGDTYVAIENVNGSQGADSLVGNNGVNLLNGYDGNDSIDGAGGHDLLDGGAGNDQLHGGSAMDQLTGGAGADAFIFVTTTESPSTAAGRDLITDFSHPQGDRIDLSLIDANTGVAGDQAFTYIGTALFTGVAGQLHTWYDAGQTIVSGDTNGDQIADFAIALTGILSPAAADFVL